MKSFISSRIQIYCRKRNDEFIKHKFYYIILTKYHVLSCFSMNYLPNSSSLRGFGSKIMTSFSYLPLRKDWCKHCLDANKTSNFVQILIVYFLINTKGNKLNRILEKLFTNIENKFKAFAEIETNKTLNKLISFIKRLSYKI